MRLVRRYGVAERRSGRPTIALPTLVKVSDPATAMIIRSAACGTATATPSIA